MALAVVEERIGDGGAACAIDPGGQPAFVVVAQRLARPATLAAGTGLAAGGGAAEHIARSVIGGGVAGRDAGHRVQVGAITVGVGVGELARAGQAVERVVGAGLGVVGAGERAYLTD